MLGKLVQTHLADFESFIHSVRERAQLEFSHELGFDERLAKHKRHKLSKVGHDEIRLVACCRVQRCHGQPLNLHVLVLQHGEEHINQHIT